MPMLVKDAMTKPVYSIEVEKTAQQAADMMRKIRKGSLVTTKGKHPVGIVTADDIIDKVVSKNLKPSSVKIADIRSSPLITISTDDTITGAAREMRRNRIKRLPVVEDGKLVGILSMTDIATVVPDFIDYLEERASMSNEEPVIREPSTTTGMCDNCDKYSTHLKMADNQWLCEDCREDAD